MNHPFKRNPTYFLLIAALVAVLVLPGGTSSLVVAATQVPNPRLFRIAPADFPWQTSKLTNSRIESNARASHDALPVYTPKNGAPTWDGLKRVTGFYEQAVMERGSMRPLVTLLIGEYQSESDAHAAFAAEVASRAPRPLKSRPSLGSESVEFAWSFKRNKHTERVETSLVYTRYHNFELDVLVSEIHKPQNQWINQYRAAALTLVHRLVTAADKALQQAPTSTPTTSTAATATLTVAPTSGSSPTPTVTATTSTAAGTVVTPTATATTVSSPTSTPTTVGTAATPTQTSTPTATATATDVVTYVPRVTPTATTPASSGGSACTPPETQGSSMLFACISDVTPPFGGSITITGHYKANGQGKAGVLMDASWTDFDNNVIDCQATTDSTGTAKCSHAIGVFPTDAQTQGIVQVAFSDSGTIYPSNYDLTFTPH